MIKYLKAYIQFCNFLSGYLVYQIGFTFMTGLNPATRLIAEVVKLCKYISNVAAKQKR